MSTLTVNDIRDAIWSVAMERKKPICRVAQQAGIAYNTLRRFLKGDRGMTIDTLMLVLDALGMEITLQRKGAEHDPDRD